MNYFTVTTCILAFLTLGFCRPIVVIEKPTDSKTEIFIKFENK